MATRTIGIIMHGATGRICSTQHLQNALAPIRDEGGLPLGEDLLVPRLLLVGRDEERVGEVARAHNVADWSTDLDGALADTEFPIFFDAAATHLRVDTLRRALAAGKHIYTEKPVAPSVEIGLTLLREAESRGVKHGAVEDKRHLPGFLKLAHLINSGFFGRIVGFRLEFGWWVFDGISAPAQRPSWNYQMAGGGGLISDMYPHWRYVIEGLLGPITQVSAKSWTAQPERADEIGTPFAADVEDSVATMLELESGVVGTILSTWATRVRRDDLVTLQIDGTDGSAVAGLRHCHAQAAADTPPIMNFNMGAGQENMKINIDYRAGWTEVPDITPYKNPYRAGWEGFLAHVAIDAPFASDLMAGIRDVQLAAACQQSDADGGWVSMAPVARLP